MNQKLIVIDGKSYKSVDEMPEDVRRNYEAALGNLDKDRNGTLDMLENVNSFFEDKNKDGMPDAFDGLTSNVITTTKVVADGKEYTAWMNFRPRCVQNSARRWESWMRIKTVYPTFSKARQIPQFRQPMSCLLLGRKPRVVPRRYLLPL